MILIELEIIGQDKKNMGNMIVNNSSLKGSVLSRGKLTDTKQLFSFVIQEATTFALLQCGYSV